MNDATGFPDISLFAVIRKSVRLMDRATRMRSLVLGVFIVISTLMEAVGIGLVFPVVTAVSDPGLIASNEWARLVFGEIDDSNLQNVLTMLVLCFFAIIVFKNLLLLVVAALQARFIADNQAALSNRLLAHYLSADYKLHLTRNSADLVNLATATAAAVYSHGVQGLLALGAECLVIIFVAGILLYASPALTVVAAVLIVPFAAVIYFAVKNRLVGWGRVSINTQERLLQLLQQALHSIKEVTIFGGEKFIHDEYAVERQRLADVEAKIRIVGNIPRLWIETVVVSGIVGGIIYAIHNETDAGSFFSVMALFAAAAFRLVPSFNRTLISLNTIRGGTYPVNTVYAELIESGAVTTDLSRGQIPPLAFEKSIVFENVSFSYPGMQVAAIEGISVVIEKGQSVGLVGTSGAGKTTFADILLGLLKPSAGRVLVDGIDVADNMRGWQQNLSYVPQAVYLLDDIFRRNIAFCLPDDDIDDKKVWAAIRNAQLENFVRSLPGGLDAPVGDRGIRLSGGQKQRIGIARALYRDPDVLVLDEATSALDSEAEHSISNAIEKLSGTKTIVTIAHRLSTVRKCDTLLFLQDGRLIDQGSFEDLQARNATFHKLVELSKL